MKQEENHYKDGTHTARSLYHTTLCTAKMDNWRTVDILRAIIDHVVKDRRTNQVIKETQCSIQYLNKFIQEKKKHGKNIETE